jgi:hypothetical protein
MCLPVTKPHVKSVQFACLGNCVKKSSHSSVIFANQS